jgi:hypothetical protein
MWRIKNGKWKNIIITVDDTRDVRKVRGQASISIKVAL